MCFSSKTFQNFRTAIGENWTVASLSGCRRGARSAFAYLPIRICVAGFAGVYIGPIGHTESAGKTKKNDENSPKPHGNNLRKEVPSELTTRPIRRFAAVGRDRLMRARVTFRACSSLTQPK